LVGAKCGLPLITLSDMDIIVSPVHVKLGEIVQTLEAMDQVVDQWEWVVILVHGGIHMAMQSL
jgi:hypothetical protein